MLCYRENEVAWVIQPRPFSFLFFFFFFFFFFKWVREKNLSKIRRRIATEVNRRSKEFVK